ncbi:zf-HC2 domain-containing protein, partial [Streptomyces anulatus]|uniref:zf-HC2 domain-containing protein n=1 Tax=Streptomyces anulatus TaxID=1892 RepID=UPI00364F0E0A
MSVEHPSDRLVAGYARGDTDLSADELWAVEAHMEQCAGCRGRLAGAAADVPAVTALLTAVRDGLEPALDRSTPAPRRRRFPMAWATPVMGPWLSMVIGVSVVAGGGVGPRGWSRGGPPGRGGAGGRGPCRGAA